MFTPPPSPLPSRLCIRPQDPESSPLPSSPSSPTKPPTSPRSIRWSVLAIPLFLIFLAAATRYIDHPAFFDALIPAFPCPSLSPWAIHKRHPDPPLPSPNLNNSPSPLTSSAGAPLLSGAVSVTTVSTSTLASPSPTTSLTNQPLPPIPTMAPALPTPFPQPLDDLTRNFSSVSCYNFFTNMTSSQAFRTCRPLSLLIQSSSSFLEAQNNLTVLNTLIWGTCNTVTPDDVCADNMAWFASALKAACISDLADNNAYAADTLVALQAYSLMRDVGCFPAPAPTNAYCYVAAARNPNPSDLFFYGLPLGIALPSTVPPLCSACTAAIMARYAAALQDSRLAPILTALQKTYDDAAQHANRQCGAAYVQTGLAKSAAISIIPYAHSCFTICAALLGWILLLS